MKILLKMKLKKEFLQKIFNQLIKVCLHHILYQKMFKKHLLKLLED